MGAGAWAERCLPWSPELGGCFLSASGPPCPYSITHGPALLGHHAVWETMRSYDRLAQLSGGRGRRGGERGRLRQREAEMQGRRQSEQRRGITASLQTPDEGSQGRIAKEAGPQGLEELLRRKGGFREPVGRKGQRQEAGCPGSRPSGQQGPLPGLLSPLPPRAPFQHPPPLPQPSRASSSSLSGGPQPPNSCPPESERLGAGVPLGPHPLPHLLPANPGGLRSVLCCVRFWATWSFQARP